MSKMRRYALGLLVASFVIGLFYPQASAPPDAPNPAVAESRTETYWGAVRVMYKAEYRADLAATPETKEKWLNKGYAECTDLGTSGAGTWLFSVSNLPEMTKKDRLLAAAAAVQTGSLCPEFQDDLGLA